MTLSHKIDPGDTVTNNQLREMFRCGLQGGMRRSLSTNTLVLISDHTAGIYDDRWDDNILYYTGMGLRGDQKLGSAQNKTLAHSRINGVELHLFEVFTRGQYVYMGNVSLHSEPFQEDQPDKDGKYRKVWIFPLSTGVNPRSLPSKEILTEVQEYREKRAAKMTDLELREAVEKGSRKTSIRLTTAKTYERNVFVAELARRRANGICQLCEKPAPFVTRGNRPYLETHHIVWLSQGGEDTINNTVALCPNCHRKVHSLNNVADNKLLIKKLE